jgi:tripartite-type tricarboxylate transporter receptor subunit TctC
MSMQIVKSATLFAALALAGGSALAQSYPTKNVLFLTGVVGGAPEAFQRAIFEKVKENTGATFILEPRPGGGGAPGLQAVKAAAPDGYTFGVTYASALNLNPLINRDLGIDALRDFVPVTNLMTLGVVIAARDDFAAKDVRELVAAARARPGQLRIGVFGAGNKSWVAMLEEKTGAKFLQVPFKSSTESVTATLGGHIDVHFETVGTLLGQKGKLKALSFGGLAASQQLPGVPVVRDLYQFDMLSWFAVLAPAGTPASAVNWVSRELVRAQKDPKITTMIESTGFTVLGNTPDEFARMLRAEVEANAEIVKKYPDIR